MNIHLSRPIVGQNLKNVSHEYDGIVATAAHATAPFRLWFVVCSHLLPAWTQADLCFLSVFLDKIYGVRSSKFNWALCAQLQAKFIDPVFAKTSPKRSFTVTENKRCGLDFAKTGSKIRAYWAPPSPHSVSFFLIYSSYTRAFGQPKKTTSPSSNHVSNLKWQ